MTQIAARLCMVLLAAVCLGTACQRHRETSSLPHQSEATLQSYLNDTRDAWQQPRRVVAALGLREGQVVADIGAGSGYFTNYLSQAVGKSGKVWSVDIDEQAIDFMRERLRKVPPPFPNVELQLSAPDNCNLQAHSIDCAFLCDVHIFLPEKGEAATLACLRSIKDALRAAGRVAVIEVQDDAVRGHVSLARLCQPFEAVGLRRCAQFDFLVAHERPAQYFVIFKVP